MKRLLTLIIIALLGYCAVALTGCASLKETGRCILGTSTEELEEGRNKAITKKFNLNISECYSKLLNSLAASNHYIYTKEQNRMIAMYNNSSDTTAVGVFFKEIDKDNTEVQVSSPSTYVRETIAKEVFAVLDQAITAIPKKEESPAIINASAEENTPTANASAQQ